MENKRNLKIFLITIALIIVNADWVNAYEVNVHQALTYKIIQEYSRLAPTKHLELKRYMGQTLKGSVDEDEQQAN